ncbi:DoxX family protein [Neobacillus niacini]|uniref:DoxX family protein n=1 Tax=Neobacillus niacini TaxID=86668 RepID=UPI002FFE23FE
MIIALWIVQILLGLMFLMAGTTKAFSYEKAKASMPWVKDSSKGLVMFIGVAELLGGLGLILPYALGIAPILTPIAAIGLGVIMILAAVFHAKRKENQAIGMNIILLALAIFVAIGRW